MLTEAVTNKERRGNHRKTTVSHTAGAAMHCLLAKNYLAINTKTCKAEQQPREQKQEMLHELPQRGVSERLFSEASTRTTFRPSHQKPHNRKDQRKHLLRLQISHDTHIQVTGCWI